MTNKHKVKSLYPLQKIKDNQNFIINF